MPTAWATNPRTWQKQTAIVLATGPSLSPDVVEAAREAHATGVRVIAVSDAFTLAPWADMLYSCDAKWWQHHAQEALKFPGLKVTCDSSVPFPSVLSLQIGGHTGLDERPTHLRTAGNSGHQAVHIAAQMGAEKILLCGFDMRRIHKKRHFFGDHPPYLHRNSPYEDFVRDFEPLANDLRKQGVIVINCTPGSALQCFPVGTIEEELHGT